MKVVCFALCLTTLVVGQSAPLHIKSAVAAFQAGEDAVQKRNFEQATNYFRKAIEIEPTFQSAFESLSSACLSAGHPSDAAVALTQLLEIVPDLTRSRILLGRLLLEANEPLRALAQFSLALKYDPVNADALLGFASAASFAGMNDRALDALARGRKQYPGDARFNTRSR